LLRDDAGLAEYDDALVNDAELIALARKVHYRIDPSNPYPERFTGHLRVRLKDGRVIEERQDYFRGGVDHPLSDSAIAHKFAANCAYGGMTRDEFEAPARAVPAVFDLPAVSL
jgi:2-methylcitrate dehydratase PrpD